MGLSITTIVVAIALSVLVSVIVCCIMCSKILMDYVKLEELRFDGYLAKFEEISDDLINTFKEKHKL